MPIHIMNMKDILLPNGLRRCYYQKSSRDTKILDMARSNIGRLLNERAEREIAKMGLELVDGVCHDIQTYHYYVGRTAAIRWFLQQIDEIEGPNE